ncbi:hypothetical protein [Azohydromonas australica]|uniref:hypothetical protein n=1 Tax=Azohydromonas australica TaxID=364039 RepID=UPI00048FD4B1|nr:hypothetical protein [Azohydromonas australica]
MRARVAANGTVPEAALLGDHGKADTINTQAQQPREVLIDDLHGTLNAPYQRLRAKVVNHRLSGMQTAGAAVL